MRITINFLVKKTRQRSNGDIPIYVRFTLNAKRAELATGFYCKLDEWDEVGQRLKGKIKSATLTNNYLSNIRSEILDYYYQFKATGEYFDIISIKNKLLNIDESNGVLEVFDYYLKSMLEKLGNGYSKETYKHYKSSRSRLAEFIRKHGNRKDFPLKRIDYKFLNAFDIFLKKEYKVHQNTAWNYHKHNRRVLNLAISMDLIQKNPYSKFKVQLEETNREFLTQHELDTIEAKEIEIPRLAAVRDIFVFACYTGLSYSDISKLSIDHLQRGVDNKNWIIIDRSKTKSRCRIPLLPQAVAILNKYNHTPELQIKGLLLPVLTNQKMNSYLKELGDICDIKKSITMHIARHTFATTVTLSNGVPIETVSKILGHTNLKTTQIYAKIVDQKISDDMNVLQSKLANKKRD